jgi:hypothetical protein
MEVMKFNVNGDDGGIVFYKSLFKTRPVWGEKKSIHKK